MWGVAVIFILSTILVWESSWDNGGVEDGETKITIK